MSNTPQMGDYIDDLSPEDEALLESIWKRVPPTLYPKKAPRDIPPPPLPDDSQPRLTLDLAKEDTP